MHKLVNALIVSDLALDNERINLDNKTLDLSALSLNDTHIEILASGVCHIFCVSCKATEKELLLKYN